VTTAGRPGDVEGLTIGELSARTGVAPSALRFYEAEGLISASRTGGGQRRYGICEQHRPTPSIYEGGGAS